MKLDSLKKSKVFEQFDKRIPEKELEDLTLFMERKRKKQRRWEPTLFNKRVESR